MKQEVQKRANEITKELEFLNKDKKDVISVKSTSDGAYKVHLSGYGSLVLNDEFLILSGNEIAEIYIIRIEKKIKKLQEEYINL